MKKLSIVMILIFIVCCICSGCTSKAEEQEKAAQIKAEENNKAFMKRAKELEKQEIPTKGSDKIGQAKQ